MEKIKIKWDGITEIEKIMPAILGLITDEEQQQAKKMAYGDFAEIICKKYRNRGTNSGGLFVDAFRDKIMVYAEKTTYFMTWNKAAKYICQWLKDEENLRLDMGMNGACEVNEMSSTKSANLTISNKEENIMENQVITQNQEIIITENYSRAVSLHRKICANAQAAQESLFEVCKGLKEMRDGKLYKELGYQNFEDYCESEVGFSRMQAHRMISIADNLPKDFVTSMLQIGTTKLSLLAKLDEPERQEIIQNNDLESTSVKELKNKISDLKKANDRLLEKASQAEKNAEDSRKKESEAWGKVSVLKTDSEMQVKKISQLEKQIQELENNPKQVAVEDTTKINELKEEIKKLKADSASEIDSMKTRHNQEKADFMREKNELNKKLENKQKEFASKHNEWLESCKENAALTGQLYDAETERDEAYEKIQSLEKQIQELENRPVEVAVKDNSEEIESLKKQLEQERQKSAEFEEKKKRIEAELEKDRNSFKSKTPDNSELFEVYYQNCIDSIEKLFAFLRNKNLKSFNGRLYDLSDILNDNISMLDEY